MFPRKKASAPVGCGYELTAGKIALEAVAYES
jgi:hypothetical protein